MLLELASKEERRKQLIVLHVGNITFSEFLLFSSHSSWWMQDTKFWKNVQVLECVFDWRALLEYDFITNIYIIIIFYQYFSFSKSFHPDFHIFKP